MTAFEGSFKSFFFSYENVVFYSAALFIPIEFGVLPEIAKAVDEMEWT